MVALSVRLPNERARIRLIHLHLCVPPKFSPNAFSMVEPGEPRSYSQREIHDFSQRLLSVPRPGFTIHDDDDRDDPPFVRPVNYQCQFLIDDSNPRLKTSEKVCFVVTLFVHLSI